jgi:hypothetical protein
MKIQILKSAGVLAAAVCSILLLAVWVGRFATPIVHASPSIYTVDRTDDVAGATGCTIAASDCSLRGAIINANANAGSTIIIPAGTYGLTITQSGGNDATTGDLNLTANMIISGAGSLSTIIQGGPGWADRIFDVSAPAQISGVALQGGFLPADSGGAIYNHSVLTVTNSTFVSNTASFGGALENYGSLMLFDDLLMSNTAVTGGGAIVNYTLLVISGSQFISNTSGNNGGAITNGGKPNGKLTMVNSSIVGSRSQYGGGLINYSSVTLTNISVMSNSAKYGGGLYNFVSTMTMQSGSIVDNFASSDGGGLYSTGSVATLSGVAVLSNTAASNGGSINAEGGWLTLTGVQLMRNTALAGGGLYVDYAAQVMVSSTLILSNTGTSDGGGFYNSNGVLEIANSTLRNNRSSYGGVIVNRQPSTATLVDDMIVANFATNGYGGVLDNLGFVSIVDSSLISNSAVYKGGAIQNYNFGTINISGSTLLSNTTGDSGGAIANSGILTLTNTTVSHNLAKGNGGGLYQSAAMVTLTSQLQNDTIVANVAEGDGGGVYQSSAGPIYALNTLIAQNVDTGGQAPDCNSINSLGYNLIQTTTGCTINGILTGVISNTDPMIGPLQDNGGSTWTHALIKGSPAIDAGDPVNCPATDQRDAVRPIGPRCDISAFEAPLWVYLPLVLK